MKTSININVIALHLNENTLKLFYADSRVSFTKGLSQVAYIWPIKFVLDPWVNMTPDVSKYTA